MSYFLVKNLSLYYFVPKPAPFPTPSDALLKISGAVARNAVARDVLVSRVDDAQTVSPRPPTPSAMGGDNTQLVKLGIIIDEWGRFYCVAKSLVYDYREGIPWNGEHSGLGSFKRAIDAFKQFRCMAKLLVARPSGDTLDDDEKDKVQEFFIGQLKTVRRILEPCQYMKKLLVVGPSEETLDEDEKDMVQAVRLMGEAYQLPGLKYDQLFSPTDGIELAGFNHVLLIVAILWTKDIENAVKANCDRITRAEELMELRRHIASLEALLMA
jgi:hypothetical protein